MIELKNGPLAIGLAPEIGGSLAYFKLGGVDVMRPLSQADERAANVLGVAMFPMVPYANRIANNAFVFEGRTWRFAPNNPPETFNVHGTGWHRPWRAETRGEAVTLTLEHLAPDEPYSYLATQTFELTDRLRVTMTLVNRGAVAMPFGFGLHPWFDRDADTQMIFSAPRFFMEAPHGVAGEMLATPPELDYAKGAPLPGTWRNNDYGGWDGKAELRFPARKRSLRIEADPVFDHLMFYADPARPVFCLEPQSNAPCAFNEIGTARETAMGVRVLRSGEALQGAITFIPGVV